MNPECQVVNDHTNKEGDNPVNSKTGNSKVNSKTGNSKGDNKDFVDDSKDPNDTSNPPRPVTKVTCQVTNDRSVKIGESLTNRASKIATNNSTARANRARDRSNRGSAAKARRNTTSANIGQKRSKVNNPEVADTIIETLRKGEKTISASTN